MKKIIAAILAITFGMVALECTAAPKSQCQDGSDKVVVSNGHSKRYHCYNGEWVREK